jgi:hypothetical protein
LIQIYLPGQAGQHRHNKAYEQVRLKMPLIDQKQLLVNKTQIVTSLLTVSINICGGFKFPHYYAPDMSANNPAGAQLRCPNNTTSVWLPRCIKNATA